MGTKETTLAERSRSRVLHERVHGFVGGGQKGHDRVENLAGERESCPNYQPSEPKKPIKPNAVSNEASTNLFRAGLSQPLRRNRQASREWRTDGWMLRTQERWKFLHALIQFRHALPGPGPDA